jgi:hypothetical protein
MRGDAKYYVPDDEKGGYRYIGKYYRFGTAGDGLKLKKRTLFLCAILSLAAFLLAGFADMGETRAFYIGLPYVFSLLPAGLGLAAAFNTLRAEEWMTYPLYRRGPKRLILCARAEAILSAISLAGCAYLKARGGAVGFLFPLYLLIILLSSVAAWVIYERDPARPVG